MLRLLPVIIFCLAGLSTVAQQKKVSGRVTDIDNQPIQGATVTVKNSTRTTLTGESGEFSVEASTGEVLSISFVGFLSKEVRVGDGANINVVLSSNPASMDEVVVIGYGSSSRRDLATSVAKIDPKSVPQAANSSLSQLVFGRAPGVVATQNSSEPGGAINISIRGRGNPLVVVDGVLMPYGGLEPGSGERGMNSNVNRGGFAGINPNDIESIEFLKDASASMYGVGAANGVMLITTKKGKGRRTSVNYDGSRSLVTNMKYFEPLNAKDYMNYYNQLTTDWVMADKKMGPFGPNPIDLTDYWAGRTAYRPFTEEQIANAGVGTDWLGYVLRNGSIDNHNLTISGATDKVNYFFSGGLFNQQGTVVNSGLKRYSGRMNLTFNLTKFLSFTTNVNYSRIQNLNSQAGGQSASIGQQAFGAIQAAIGYPSYLPVFDPNTGQYTRFQMVGNPVSLLSIYDRSRGSNLFTTFSADISIIPNVLTAKIQYGNNYDMAERNYFIPSTVFFDQLNRSRAALNTQRREHQTKEATIAFKKNLGELVRMDAVGGIGEYPIKSFSFGALAADMMDGIGFDALQTGTATSHVVNSSRSETKRRSYFARSNFDIADKYGISLIYRYDGYSQFFPQNKYASFYNFGINWKISNENFLKDVAFIDLLKLRASHGLMGDPGSQAYGTFSPDGNIISFNNGSITRVPYFLSQLDVPSLRWPKTYNTTVALDFGLFNDRLSGSLDFFRDDLTDLLVNAPTDMLSFISSQPLNSGRQVRVGFELGINTSNIRTSNFDWSSMINLSRSRIRWDERQVNTFLRSWEDPKDFFGTSYVMRTSGILDGVKEIPASQPAGARLPGSPIFVDQNNDGKIDTADIVKLSNDVKLAIGFGNTFRMKQFELSVMFYGQIGGRASTPAAAWANAADFIAGGYNVVQEIDEVWTTANPTGTRPGVAFHSGSVVFPVGNDIGLQSTNFLRCRNVTLGYTFNSPFVARYASNLRVYVDVQNPFILTNFKYVDPEVSVASVKGGPAPFPMARTYSLGIRANF